MKGFNLIYYTLFLLFSLFQICIWPSEKVSKKSEIHSYLNSIFSSNSPGCIAIVKDKSGIIFEGAFGLADIQNKIPLTVEHNLQIGSVSKQFTAMGIFILIEQGKLNFTDSLGKFFPKYEKLKDITILQLLTHSSGIKDYFEISEWREDLSKPLSPNQTFDIIAGPDLDFQPGTRETYSNSGYHILGLIIETISGMELNKFLKDNIFDPSGMRNTHFIGEHLDNIATGYEKNGENYSPPFNVDPSRFYAGGAIISNISDLLKWDTICYTEELIPDTLMKIYFNPQIINGSVNNIYACGWEILASPIKIYGHGGGTNGFVSQVYRIPEKEIYVAVLMNFIDRYNSYSAASIAQHLLEIAAELKVNKEPETIFNIDEATLKKFVGKYILPGNSIRELKIIDYKLYYLSPSGQKFELIPISKTSFRSGKGSKFEFTLNSNGKVEGFELFTGRGKPVTAIKQ